MRSRHLHAPYSFPDVSTTDMDQLSPENVRQGFLQLFFAYRDRHHSAAPDVFHFLREHIDADTDSKLAVCLADQAIRWRSGRGVETEYYCARLPELAADPDAKLQLICAEFRYRQEYGQAPSTDSFLERFPDLQRELEMRLRAQRAASLENQSTASLGSSVIDPVETVSLSAVGGIRTDGRNAIVSSGPEFVAQFRIERILGDGGFGRVYLAFDEELRRQVAVKVPHPHRLRSPRDVDAYFEEARIVARLDHPSIVPVYQFGRTDDGRCFAVSKFIEGDDLSAVIDREQLPPGKIAEQLSVVADALDYSHSQGVIHRDIKPANILVDTQGQPWVTDFGIALKEDDWGKDLPSGGTPAYMSPEQICGEGHRVDGRSDVFSLGVVLYEMLTGQRPFGKTWVERRASVAVTSPRNVKAEIPAELERICLKAMSPRRDDRYATAGLMASDLRAFGKPRAADVQQSDLFDATKHDVLAAQQEMQSPELQIVPRGLRSFGQDDADFYSDLLPGPRDRSGVPESVTFWTTKIQERTLRNTFSVGLIYGPSGCGKSSFLKAAVLPALPPSVVHIYIEASSQYTEAHLLEAVRDKCPEVDDNLDLADTLASLRRGGLADGHKVLLVIDQFEQWLRSRSNRDYGVLGRAFRQCDGRHLQAVVSVRDDFWIAVANFMHDVEAPLASDVNFRGMDLFTVSHAEKILTAQGRAYGALPTAPSRLELPQHQFVHQAVAGLARNTRVVPVHLALFAEMVKDKPWTPSTLRKMGGTEGVGVTFLEETFNSRSANPEHRMHQQAARAVLAALLPESGGEIKGSMQAESTLLNAAGYQGQEREFAELIRVLDTELRLITPTEPAECPGNESATGKLTAGNQKYYHLTHDYLVPSITEWVSQKKKQTRRGRAELLLEERTKIWQARPSTRTLPTLAEWLRILALAPVRNRDHLNAEQAMMKQAGRFHAMRLVLLFVIVTGIAGGAYYSTKKTRAFALAESLRSAATQDVPEIIGQVDDMRAWIEPVLADQLGKGDSESRAQLHLRLALLKNDPRQVHFLRERMLKSTPVELQIIADSLRQHGDVDEVVNFFGPVLLDKRLDSTSRFRASAALAAVGEPSFGLTSVEDDTAEFVAEQLLMRIKENRLQLHSWSRIFHSVHDHLNRHLSVVFSDSNRGESDREVAALILGQFIADRPEDLVELLLKATPSQHRILWPKLQSKETSAIPLLQTIYERLPAEEDVYEERSSAAERRAHAAALLFTLERYEPSWAGLLQADDVELTSFLETRLGELSVDCARVHGKLTDTKDARQRSALLRALCGFSQQSQDRLDPSLRQQCIRTFERLFLADPDSGVHSAAQSAVTRWVGRQRPLELQQQCVSTDVTDDRNWYVTESGNTMAVFRDVKESVTGSPPDEPKRDLSDESIVVQPVGYDFAVSTTEVTCEQFDRFDSDYRHRSRVAAVSNASPMGTLTWHVAAAYCLWLSKEEGIPEDQWCFVEVVPEVKGEISADDEPAVIELVDDYLSRTGYRMATEAEWEYCCRAGARTKFFWGNAARISGNYAWHGKNSGGLLHPVGALLPNSFGMYDMHGNATEWTQEIYQRTIGFTEEVSHTQATEIYHVGRGGAASSFLWRLRAANRTPAYGDDAYSLWGLRVARTIHP